MVKGISRSAVVGVGAALAASLAMVGCGGSSGGTRPGSGGSTGTGTGGSTGAGGAIGSGGSTGAGGTGTGGSSSTTTLSCSPGVSPASPSLTTFTQGTDWSNTTGNWGVAGNLQGSVYAYNGSMTGTDAFKAAVDTTAGVLDIGKTGTSGDVPAMIAAGDYAGGGLSFKQCVNTTAYSGVTFTVGGSTGGCDLYFQVQTFDEQGASNGGGCPSTASCYKFPQTLVAPGSGALPTTPVTVSFTDLSGGAPDAAAAIAMEIVGLQFQMQSSTPVADASQTGCTNVLLTVDNVAFVQ